MIENEYRSSLLKPQDILEKWQILKPHIESANEHSAGEMTPFDIALLAMVGKAHIWLTVDQNDNVASVIVTRFIEQTRRKTMLIQTCGGSVEGWDAWTAHHDNLIKFAQDNMCSSIQIWGRKGWQRRLRHLTNDTGRSYKHLYQVYNMEI
jgi:hypothetical protein